MSISDWSSDVCSSDRRLEQERDVMKAARDLLQHEGDVMRLVRTREEDCQAGFVLVAYQFLADAEAKDRLEQVTIGDNLGAAQQEMGKPDHHIGRASCRERVCQYV